MTETEFTMRALTVLDALKDKRVVPSDRQFAIKIGIDPTQISNARKGNRQISSKYIDKIVTTFGVNRVYLDAGIGEMFSQHVEDLSLTVNDAVNNKNTESNKIVTYKNQPPHNFNRVHEQETQYTKSETTTQTLKEIAETLRILADKLDKK